MNTISKTATAFGTGVSHQQESFEAGKEAASKALSKLSGTKAELGIIFCSSKYNYSDVLKGIRSVSGDTQLIGCSSASEFTEEEVTKDSVVCAFLSSTTHKFHTSMGMRLAADPLVSLESATRSLQADYQDYPHQSAIMLIDALSGKGEDVCAAAVLALGPTVRFAGGAAGDNLTFNNCSVFHNGTASKDAVALCVLHSKKPVAIGVRHGHLAISPPLTLTKASGNVVYQIEGRPAFEVWKENTRMKAEMKGIQVDQLQSASDIGAYFMQYEAGLLVGAEYKVRAPLSANPDGSINFACAMVEGAVIRIMESPNKTCQINSAKQAAEAALKATRGAKIAGAIVFDCVCRNLILEAEFTKAVEEIKKVLGHIPVIGFATYGEIAMEVGQLSGFHNTTTVVLLIPE